MQEILLLFDCGSEDLERYWESTALYHGALTWSSLCAARALKSGPLCQQSHRKFSGPSWIQGYILKFLYSFLKWHHHAWCCRVTCWCVCVCVPSVMSSCFCSYSGNIPKAIKPRLPFFQPSRNGTFHGSGVHSWFTRLLFKSLYVTARD